MINELKATLERENNYQLTENGAVGYKTTSKVLVDLNFKVTSMRNLVSTTDMDLFVQAMNEDLDYAIRWLFFTRDVRGGMGERDVFQRFYMQYAELYPNEAKATLKLVAEFGRWKDVIDIIAKDHQNILGGMELVKEACGKDFGHDTASVIRTIDEKMEEQPDPAIEYLRDRIGFGRRIRVP